MQSWSIWGWGFVIFVTLFFSTNKFVGWGRLVPPTNEFVGWRRTGKFSPLHPCFENCRAIVCKMAERILNLPSSHMFVFK